MSFIDLYNIPFKDLSQGKVHKFEFEVNEEFFQNFDYSEYKEGQVKIVVDLVVNPNNLVLDFYLYGQVKVVCDVCLSEFFHPIKYYTTLYVKLGNFNTDWFDYDQEIVIDRSEVNINIAKHIYDFINLALPIKKVHPLDSDGKPTCDPFMLKMLEELSPGTNKENNSQSNNLDSRWDALRKLLN